MENLRVYEAARKLNIETSELMSRLAARGVTVTGPIDNVTQEDFDAVALELKEGAAPVSEEKPAEENPTPAPVLRLAPREETPVEPTPEEPVEPTPAPKSHHVAPQPHHHPKPSRAPTALSFAATGLAALALLLAVGLYTSVKEHGAGIATLATQSAATDAAVKSAASNADTALAMSVNNTTRIAQVDQRVTVAERTRLSGELTRRSAALDELANTLPTAQGDKVAELARRLDLLARSL